MTTYIIRFFALHSANLAAHAGEAPTASPEQRRFGHEASLRSVLLGIFAVAITVLSGCKAKAPAELLVFAAASTADVMTDVGNEFTASTKAPVRFSFGGSRDLGRQIRSGAPAGVILAADAETVDALVEAKLVRVEDRRVVASNQLVVIVPMNAGFEIRNPADLALAKHIAVGDPKLVPAGAYARKWLEGEGLWTSLEAQIVPTADVRAALAAVNEGHAEAGIVYRTDAARASSVRVAFEVPTTKTPSISYVAARIDTVAAPSAPAFVDFLTGPTGRAAFSRHGFIVR